MAQPHGLFDAALNHQTNTAAPEFRIKQRDQLLLGLLPLAVTIAAAGNFDGGQASLEFYLASGWIASGVVLNAAGASATIDSTLAPTGVKYRFLFSGGGGSLNVSIQVAGAFEMEPVT